MRRENCVYQGRFPQSSLTCNQGKQKAQDIYLSEPTDTYDVELEASLQQLPLNLGCDAVEPNMALRHNRGLI